VRGSSTRLSKGIGKHASQLASYDEETVDTATLTTQQTTVDDESLFNRKTLLQVEW